MLITTNNVQSEKEIIVSIITANYNRKEELIRSFLSVTKLDTSYAFEVIIVDDGSTINLNDTYRAILKTVSFPITLIKKENGGVHTARNVGINFAKGKFCIFLDSDDELLPNCIDDFMDAFKTIKEEDFFEIKGMCINERGKKLSKPLPRGFNQYNKKKKKRWISKNCGEMIGFRRTNILKENNFPEPEGIKFVSENILWEKLRLKYKTFYLDKTVRIYHCETNDSLTKVKNKSIQHCINRAWNHLYYINNNYLYSGLLELLKNIFIYSVFQNVMSFYNINAFNTEINNTFYKIIYFMLKPISNIYAKLYIKKHMIK